MNFRIQAISTPKLADSLGGATLPSLLKLAGARVSMPPVQKENTGFAIGRRFCDNVACNIVISKWNKLNSEV